MKVLLTRPDNTTPMLIPNIGLGYLAAALRTAGIEVQILDCIKEKLDAPHFYQKLVEEKFDVVGFQVYTFDVAVINDYIEAANRARPNSFLIAGGPHPTADPEYLFRSFPQLNVLFCGEAERALSAFCSFVEKERVSPAQLKADPALQERVRHIPGIVLPGGNGYVPDYLEPLDSIPMPAWDLISPLTYPPAPQGTFTKQLPVAPIIVTRGCPFACTFCAAHLTAGRKLRFRSPKIVVDEIEFLIETYGIREIHFEDDNFTLKRQVVVEVCNELIARNIDVTWACPNGVRLDSLDKELLQLMEHAGCYSLAVGIESGNQRILNMMKKKLKVKEVERRINVIKQHTRMNVTGFFLIGYPGETVAEIKETIAFSKQLNIDKVNFGAFMPLPGTESYHQLKSQGKLDNLNYQKITEYRAAMSFGDYSTRTLKFLLQYAFVSFYIRPKIIYRFFKEIKSWYQIKILFIRLLEVFSP